MVTAYYCEQEQNEVYIVSLQKTEHIRTAEGKDISSLCTSLSFRNEGNVPWKLDTAFTLGPGEPYNWFHSGSSIGTVNIHVEPDLCAFQECIKNGEIAEGTKPVAILLIVKTTVIPERIVGFDNFRKFFTHPTLFR